ncbi:MAG: TVP38/TMEM64 family protein [Firmicutes bacterium]|nr:TVP38/TMEM64 family protein [Bacillota bacterium]
MNEERKEKRLALIKMIVLVAVIVLVPSILFLTHRELFSEFDSVEKFEAYIQSFGNKSIPVFIIVQILQVVISAIPGEIVQVAAGFMFSPFKAFILVMIGCLIGEIFAFYIGKLLGRDFVKAFISHDKLEHYTGLLNSKKGYTICFLLYLIPGIPKDFLCYIAGISEMDIKYFLVLSLLGRIPGLIGSVAMGSLIGQDRYVLAIIIFAVACIVAFLGVIFRDKLHAKLEEIKERAQNNR